MKLLSPSDVTQKLRDAVDSRTPYSLVRMGDGEWTIIKYPEHAKLSKCKERIARWIGDQVLNIKQIRSIRNQIHIACRDANILGVPTDRERQVMAKWKNFVPLCNSYQILGERQELFHFYQIHNLDFKYILKNVNEIYCITSRDITDNIKPYFNLHSIKTFLIPPETFIWNEKMRKHNQNLNRERHYPESFEKIMRFIKTENIKGKVFLVGAGGFGKSYCHHIKLYGGIGIDIGALFDGWAGICTRPFLKRPERFKL